MYTHTHVCVCVCGDRVYIYMYPKSNKPTLSNSGIKFLL